MCIVSRSRIQRLLPRFWSVPRPTSAGNMNSGDDGLDPWEREVADDFMDGPPNESQMLPPDDEYFSAVGEEMHRASDPEPTARVVAPDKNSPASAVQEAPPVPRPVLPLSQPEARGSDEKQLEENSTTPPPLLAQTMLPAPKLRRLSKKTTVSPSVCPQPLPPSAFDLESELFEHKEDFLAVHFSESLMGNSSTTGCTSGCGGSTSTKCTRVSCRRRERRVGRNSAVWTGSGKGDVLSKSWMRISEQGLLRPG